MFELGPESVVVAFQFTVPISQLIALLHGLQPPLPTQLLIHYKLREL